MSEVPSPGVPLELRGQVFEASNPAVMAIINRTSDSFFPGARHLDDDVAVASVDAAIEDGADIVDIGGIKAAPGAEISVAEEVDRVVGFVAAVRERHPQVIISIDTWRTQVAAEACRAGADMINDTWAGHDPGLPAVAAQFNAGLVCSHTGGVKPRTRPHRVRYGNTEDGVVHDVVRSVSDAAYQAVAQGVNKSSVLLDPTHDFGKNTWHGLELLRSTPELVDCGFPVLMALSRKDFIGETLGVGVTERLPGTLAATAIAVWLGARAVRAHDVRATRQAVDMAASIRGDRLPDLVTRGLA